MSYKVLLLEDDELFSETIKDFLEEEEFKVSVVEDAKKALNRCYKGKYDLYLFDVKVPFMSGFDLLKELRSSGDDTPTIFITSYKEKENLTEGFLSGADDYIKKPVDLDELLFRIKAVLKRSIGEELVDFDGFRFDMKRKILLRDNIEVELNKKESELLALLLKNRKKIVTKEMIYDKLWDNDEIISDGALRVYINNLKKIFGKNSITNIRGVGYRFEK
ncbi:response regulator transcription factor [Nitrosophilus kaiyonis]|uniref:response regulator transcription factor n=1 Tax=Nitrosophilus kaiyonis TaxID=2930200 RepID=UPI002492A029|nr:response regulator transcription factor [Nitrosophilus kaiyonis]